MVVAGIDLRLHIAAMGARGEGIARHGDEKFFVPLTLPGETVNARIRDGRGEIVSFVTPSPDRVEPFCTHFGVCGGCQVQHWAPGPYRAWKRDLVATALARAGLDAEIAPLIDAHGEGRRRARLHATRDGAGYMTARSHELHPITSCPVLTPALSEAPAIARALAGILGPCTVALTATDNGPDISVASPKAARRRLAPGAREMAALAQLAERFGLCAIAVEGEVVIRLRPPSVRMGGVDVELPPASFLQPTAKGEEVLAGLVCEAAAPARSVADLFCGLGPFAFRLAQKAPVYAADADRPAIAALAGAARRARGIKAITAEARDLFAEPLTRFELERFDTVVLDPPRAGAKAQVAELARTGRVERVISVSCDPVSFARDAAALVRAGFSMGTVTPVDQFAHTSHLELVAAFTRR